MGRSGRFTHVMIYWTVWDRYMQVLYLGRAPHTKETLPDFHEKCQVTRHSQVFRGLTGSQRTPGFWGVTVTHSHQIWDSPSRWNEASVIRVESKVISIAWRILSI